ncbi:hypothetical protein KP509_36G028700 [Ceratopteris richardii]|nr:hypothetical protein KP509_36G028700 [Ceratopteris richardii]
MLVKHLRCLGYDAAVCSSKWPNSGKVPGGEYEYIDLFFTGEGNTTERLIVDLDFQSQFEIARPTNSYAAALKFLPIVFIGSVNKLQQVLQIMAEAVKMSLKQNSMPLPPWRTFEYMVAKWLSPFERSVAEYVGGAFSRQDNCSLADRGGRKQCVEQLNNLKICMVSELDKSHVQKPMNSEKNRRLCFGSRRLSTSGFAVS